MLVGRPVESARYRTFSVSRRRRRPIASSKTMTVTKTMRESIHTDPMALAGREPRRPLSAFVSSIWLADGYVPGPHQRERILPTGDCSLIIDLGAAGAAGVSGPQTESFIIETSAQFSVAGVQFRPGGAFPFFTVAMDELANLHVPLDVMWGGLASQLHEQVLEAATPVEKLDVIERLLAARLVRGRSAHPAVAYAIDAFERDPALVRIADVTGRIGLSHRRFLDLFTAEVGLTPKLFCRVRRFQSVLRRIRDGRRVEWADVALACGYYDQAHFIKDFQAFSGLNPSSYRASAGPHANHVPLSD
jgi:AraC-like DNA-binding protein